MKGGVAFKLVAVRASTITDDVRDVASVNVSIALKSSKSTSGGAIPTVTKFKLTRGLVGNAEGSEGSE